MYGIKPSTETLYKNGKSKRPTPLANNNESVRMSVRTISDAIDSSTHSRINNQSLISKQPMFPNARIPWSVSAYVQKTNADASGTERNELEFAVSVGRRPSRSLRPRGLELPGSRRHGQTQPEGPESLSFPDGDLKSA